MSEQLYKNANPNGAAGAGVDPNAAAGEEGPKADENGNITVNIPAFSGLLYLCRKGERQSKAAKIKKKNVRT